MTHKLKHQTIYWAGIVSLVLSVLLWSVPTLAKYRPPKTPSAPKDTGTNTTRGGNCDANSSAGLTPLVPLSHVGQTSTQHPTFVWFVSDRTSYPLQLRLFTSTGQPLYRTQMQSQPGIMQFSLPQNQPGLTIGQTYRWEVVLVCDPNIPSMNAVAAAEIQVVQLSSALQTQLAAAQTPQQRIDLYAESGLWYDAISQARKSPQNQSAVVELLDSLASSEAQPLREWRDRLRQIQTVERQQRQP